MSTNIYDCSNSFFRPPHRDESMGPKQNDIMRALHKYCGDYGCEFVDNVRDADVVITNDVFPPEIAKMNIPKVKRMDGIYWDRNRDRNKRLNEAARIADHVVFISEYSRRSYMGLVGEPLKSHSVVLNEVDPSIFRQRAALLPKRMTWTACVSNWARPEKRYEDIIVANDYIKGTGGFLYLIGRHDFPPTTMTDQRIIGHADESGINEILNLSYVFINFSYRDAAPKVVCQANNCGLPVVYANSGGTPELIHSGVAVEDPSSLIFEDETPRLKKDDIFNAMQTMHFNYHELSEKARGYKSRFRDMLKEYFRAILGVS